MRATVLAGVMLALSCGWDPASTYHVQVAVAGTGDMPHFFKVGDSVRFVAAIYHDRPFPSDAPLEPRSTSDGRPDLYEWTLSDTTIARMIVPGTVLMLRAGQTLLTVKTASDTALYPLTVRPRP